MTSVVLAWVVVTIGYIVVRATQSLNFADNSGGLIVYGIVVLTVEVSPRHPQLLLTHPAYHMSGLQYKSGLTQAVTALIMCTMTNHCLSKLLCIHMSTSSVAHAQVCYCGQNSDGKCMLVGYSSWLGPYTCNQLCLRYSKVLYRFMSTHAVDKSVCKYSPPCILCTVHAAQTYSS